MSRGTQVVLEFPKAGDGSSRSGPEVSARLVAQFKLQYEGIGAQEFHLRSANLTPLPQAGSEFRSEHSCEYQANIVTQREEQIPVIVKDKRNIVIHSVFTYASGLRQHSPHMKRRAGDPH